MSMHAKMKRLYLFISSETIVIKRKQMLHMFKLFKVGLNRILRELAGLESTRRKR